MKLLRDCRSSAGSEPPPGSPGIPGIPPRNPGGGPAPAAEAEAEEAEEAEEAVEAEEAGGADEDEAKAGPGEDEDDEDADAEEEAEQAPPRDCDALLRARREEEDDDDVRAVCRRRPVLEAEAEPDGGPACPLVRLLAPPARAPPPPRPPPAPTPAPAAAPAPSPNWKGLAALALPAARPGGGAPPKSWRRATARSEPLSTACIWPIGMLPMELRSGNPSEFTATFMGRKRTLTLGGRRRKMEGEGMRCGLTVFGCLSG